MKRDYDDGVKDDVVYFTGYEVEKTPAFEEMPLTVKIKKMVMGWTSALILTEENNLVV